MNNSLYDDYMRTVLGYNPMEYKNTYDSNYDNMYSMQDYEETRNNEIEEHYPDIYRVVYPMVQKVCAQNNGVVTKEIIDNMTFEIYDNIEDSEIVQDRSKESVSKEIKIEKTQDNREDRSVCRNGMLCDLIRILLLIDQDHHAHHFQEDHHLDQVQDMAQVLDQDLDHVRQCIDIIVLMVMLMRIMMFLNINN